MCRLNYNDLLNLVIEYDIETIKTCLKQLRKQQLDKRNIDVVEASPEMTAQFFMKGGK